MDKQNSHVNPRLSDLCFNDQKRSNALQVSDVLLQLRLDSRVE